MVNPEQLPAWRSLTQLALNTIARPASWTSDGKDDRFAQFSIAFPGLLADFSKQRIDAGILSGLIQLATEAQLPLQRDRLFRGDPVNVTEHRPALHTALRATADARPSIAGTEVETTFKRLAEFANAVRSGSYRGFSGRALTDVVHIGIGGSHLGPELAVEALGGHSADGLPCHFVANVDGNALESALATLNPETTLFIVVSKSFSTLETQVNASAARSWFLERVDGPDAMARHFVAITTNVQQAQAFGIRPENVYPMWDWVGGRFSLWSAVGLPIQLAAGPEAFFGFLQGARAMDEHFRTAPPTRNIPMLMALIGIWNYNFLGVASQAVLPYDQRLRLLPSYLQQLEMESNGKSVQLTGEPVTVDSMPIVWGGEGTNGQHAFHQLLHQGTRAFAADFVLTAKPAHALETHHRWLLANGLAQSQAMLLGHEDTDPHRQVTGNKPTTTILLDELSPWALGALLALYEHKVFCQGVIWNINSFDQWGVELGKRLAIPIFEQLGGQSASRQDSSTRGLVTYIRAHRHSRSAD